METKDLIVVIGDVMLDCYWHTQATRISPEVPVLVVENQSYEYRLGGAANVAANCVSMGTATVLVGCIGNDQSGEKIKKICKENAIKTVFIVDKDRPTTTKTRIIAKGHQLVRVDSESKKQINKNQARELILRTKKIAPNPSCIVISDYAKGMIGDEIMKEIRKKYPSTKIIADIKPIHARTCVGVSCITPNKEEAEQMVGRKIHNNASAMEAAKKLQKATKASVIITRAEAGMTIAEKGKKIVHIPTEAQDVYDVTGAGDTVVAVLAIFQGKGKSLLQSAKYANRAAGKVIGRKGTSVVTKKEIEDIKQWSLL